MALTWTQKADLLWKKHKHGKVSTDDNALHTEEEFISRNHSRSQDVWMYTDSIPELTSLQVTGEPTSVTSLRDGGHLYIHSDGSNQVVQKLVNICYTYIPGTDNTWGPDDVSPSVRNIVPPVYGNGYIPTITSDVNGEMISVSFHVSDWSFDYPTGLIRFYNQNLPPGIDKTSKIYVTVYKYIGPTLDSAFLLGVTGVQGPAGPSGGEASTGPTGPQGNSGGSGVQGPTGPDGPQGLTGESSATGATGPTGPQGPDGVQGPTGEASATGATGPQGPQGFQGASGTDGINGIDGTTGPQGPTGEASATGATGPQGPQGVQGASGTDGINGTNGIDGTTGPQGPTGEASATGATGPQGPQGFQGVQGPRGPQGVQGDDGPIGATGPQGDDGDSGPQGDVGPEGIPGLQGPQGPCCEGPQGDIGPMGIPGPEGQPGPTSGLIYGSGNIGLDEFGTDSEFIADTSYAMAENTDEFISVYPGSSGVNVDILIPPTSDGNRLRVLVVNKTNPAVAPGVTFSLNGGSAWNGILKNQAPLGTPTPNSKDLYTFEYNAQIGSMILTDYQQDLQ